MVDGGGYAGMDPGIICLANRRAGRLSASEQAEIEKIGFAGFLRRKIQGFFGHPGIEPMRWSVLEPCSFLEECRHCKLKDSAAGHVRARP